METPSENPAAQKSFVAETRRALARGLTATELTVLIEQEAQAVLVGEDIGRFLIEYISSNKVRVSEPADFHAVAAGQLNDMRGDRYAPELMLDEARASIFLEWDSAERGLTYLASEHPSQVDMYFKGADGQLYMVNFNLKSLQFPSAEGVETIDQDTFHRYLLQHSPFKAFASTMNSFGPGGYDNTPNGGFRDCVKALLGASQERNEGALRRQQEVAHQSLLDQIGL